MLVPLLLFLVALCARILTAALFPDPAYPDSFYYVNLARELAAGHGFSVDYIWNFVGGGRPAAGCRGGGPADPLERALDAARGAGPGALHLAARARLRLPLACPSGWPPPATAPLTWWIGRDAGLPRWQAIGAGC